MRRLLILAIALCTASVDAQRGGRNPPPPMPWVARGTCPGEGCAFGTWAACSALVARIEPQTNAPVAFTLRRGERFTADYGIVNVAAPGMVIFRDTGTIRQRNEMAPPYARTYKFGPADTLYLLNTLAEGYYVWWLHGRPDTGVFFWNSRTTGTGDSTARPVHVREASETWWVRVRNAGGQLGWLVPARAVAGIYPHYDDTVGRCARAPSR